MLHSKRIDWDCRVGAEAEFQVGALMTMACTEDVVRIKEEDVEPVTLNTFLGDERVRTQMAACQIWPEGYLSQDYQTDLHFEVPALILSGILDPVTQPKWGEEMKNYFDNAKHMVVPGDTV